LTTNLQNFVRANPIIIERKIPVVVVVLLATTAGEQRVREAILREFGQNIDLRVCEHIGEMLTAFYKSNKIWNTELEAERALNLLRELGSRIYRKNPLGYGDMGLLVVFPQTVPNNSLPILHSPARGSDAWYPLFPRPIN
jgi:hypothetical protein